MIYLISNQQSLNHETDIIFETATIDFCYEYLKDKEIISLDIETTRKFNKYGEIEGLDPYTSKIVMLQIGDKKNQFVIDVRNVDVSKIITLLNKPETLIVGQNLKFEYKHILHNYGIRINNLYDTMIAESIITNGFKTSVSLKSLIKKYLDINVNKDTRLEFLTIGSEPFTPTQIQYGAEDILFPLLIREKQLKEGKRLDLLNTFKLEFLFTPVVGEMEYQGMTLDVEKWKALYQDNLEIYNSLNTELDNYIIENYSDSKFIKKQLSLFSQDLETTINWGSSKQVVEFFVFLGICPKEVSKSTGKLSYTVNAKVLRTHLSKIKEQLNDKILWVVNKYLEFKEFEQSVTTFGLKFLEHLNPISKKVHTNFNQIVSTGRLSSRNPNLQNIPSDPRFRQCFVAPEGGKIINADYSSQEVVVLANYSKDPNMKAFFDSGETDMHSYNSSMIFKEELKGMTLKEIKDNRPDLRDKAKPVSFIIPYGGNGAAIASQIGDSVEVGNMIYDNYFKSFPDLKNYFDSCKKEALKQNYILIDNVVKRKYFFSKDWRKEYKYKGTYERAAVNYKIQGTSGSITKLALVFFYGYIRDNNLWNEVLITSVVHDEIILESFDNHKVHAKELEDCMARAGDSWCKLIPLTAEAVVSEYWHH